MRIAYFIDTEIPSPRANTVHVMRMCQAFSRAGHDVQLLCDKPAAESTGADIWDRYGIEKRFHIERISLPNWVRKYGHRFGLMLSAKKKVQKMGPCDVAYGRSLYALNYLKRKKPFIYESHREPDRLNLMYEKKILSHRNCLGLVVISQALKNRYLEICPFLREKDITVLHDCADIDTTGADTKAELVNAPGQTDVVIGYLGHLYPGKCMEVMLPVAAKCPQYTFHVVGGTQEWVDHWRTAAEKEEIRNIRFYGFVNNSKVGEYYRAFDICILPFSKSVYVDKRKALDIGKWISPLKLFEAMAYEKAILVSRIPTIEEVMTDREDALLADPDNIDEWVCKLNQLAEDPDMRKRLGQNAREKLEKDYTWQKRAERIIDIIEGKKQ